MRLRAISAASGRMRAIALRYRLWFILTKGNRVKKIKTAVGDYSWHNLRRGGSAREKRSRVERATERRRRRPQGIIGPLSKAIRPPIGGVQRYEI
ncbi:unnamed protein product, partial [Iphiclides podalirius]